MKLALLAFAILLKVEAQEIGSDILTNPPASMWLGYHGDYSGKRHSNLTQITPENVRNLSLAWAFQTNQEAALKSSPIVVNGIIYFSAPDNVWAVDALSGHQIWHYTYPPNKGSHIGQRGVSIYKNWLFFMTPDAHLISLNANNGTVRWNVTVADYAKGYWTTLSPLVVGNHVLVGVSGDFDNLQGFVRSIDPETGKNTMAVELDTAGRNSQRHNRGHDLDDGTYDPALDLVYWGTGNPTPVLTAATRPGDNLYTCSIVALKPDTGKLVWAFQPSPHDTHDWDAVETPVLVDGDFHGAPKKMLMQTSRNGYFFVLDRESGKSLLTEPFGPVNWAKGIDKDGRPIPDEKKEPARDGRLIAPDEGGLTNYRSPSFDPKSGLFIVSAHPSYGIYFNKPADGTFGWAGADYGVWGKGVLKAIDYQTGETRWEHELGQGGSGVSVLSTGSGLTFTGDAKGNVLALGTAGGKTLWHAGQGANMQSSPVTFQLHGRQFLLTSAGTVLFAYALPERDDMPVQSTN